MSRPNIFNFATSEFSQDAFLCWLAAWAAPDAAAEDEHLHAVGNNFIGAMFSAHGRTVPVISSLEVRRQYRGNIDIAVFINGDIVVCIEDKTGSVEHSNQLTRYVEGLKAEGHLPESILPIYVQTFDQGSYASVKGSGYAPISRRTLLDILAPCASRANANAIARDFYEHLNRIEQETESFRTQPRECWSWLAWHGFYRELQVRLGAGEWGAVNNPSGGFLGFWWHATTTSDCELYLQLEQSRLCFKIGIEDAGNGAEIGNRWNEKLIAAGQTLHLDVIRPQRIRSGSTMTVATLASDYRVLDANGVLDLDATTEQLRLAERVLDGAASTLS